jgi:hypothetical protein
MDGKTLTLESTGLPVAMQEQAPALQNLRKEKPHENIDRS